MQPVAKDTGGAFLSDAGLQMDSLVDYSSNFTANASQWRYYNDTPMVSPDQTWSMPRTREVTLCSYTAEDQ